jgi:hypothetical protein
MNTQLPYEWVQTTEDLSGEGGRLLPNAGPNVDSVYFQSRHYGGA